MVVSDKFPLFRKPASQNVVRDMASRKTTQLKPIDKHALTGFVPANAARHSYVQAITRQIGEKKTKLNYVKKKIDQAVSLHRIVASDQLLNAQRQADALLLVAQDHLEKLIEADGDSWEELKGELGIACDNLSDSLKKFVARVN